MWHMVQVELEVEQVHAERIYALPSLPVHFMEALTLRREEIPPSRRRRRRENIPPVVSRKKTKMLSPNQIEQDQEHHCCKRQCLQLLNRKDFEENRKAYAELSDKKSKSQMLLNYLHTNKNPDSIRWSYTFRGRVCF